MTEREIRQLYRLLGKFRDLKDSQFQPDPNRLHIKANDEFNAREGSILSAVAQWVKWYGQEVLNMDRVDLTK